MAEYKAPLRDMSYLLFDVFDFDKHLSQLDGMEEISRDDLEPVLEECGNFASKVVGPLMRSGDEEGVGFKDGTVTLPEGWVDSYKKYVENGWPLLEAPVEYGGTGLPSVMGFALSEMLASANPCWGMLPGLTTAANEVIERHATDEIKQKYLPKMCSGEWFGTMCLTEPQAGTDLGLIRTKAEDNGDGTYTINGSKMFITAGDHDATENIVHLVLAKLPGAPSGSKGISLFLVPKISAHDDGSLGDSNGVTCGSIEHKMGIKASPTCVINFDNAKGVIIGEPNQGLSMMFTMMNIARIGTGIQGYSCVVGSYQGALEYAKDRLQMRSLSGVKNPDGAADPIIVHPDVRKMLITQKSLVEGCRALVFYASTLVDQEHHGKDEGQSKRASQLLGFLTPIIKGFSTEIGVEGTNLGVQALGGHGYICEHGLEQFARDARITPIYEGTTGVQALDLLGRKVLMNQGRDLKAFAGMAGEFCQEIATQKELAPMAASLGKCLQDWGEITMKVGEVAGKNPDEVGAASVDYLMYSGYVVLGYMWALMAKTSLEAIAAGKADDFHNSKVKTARFYFERILPRVRGLKATILAGSESMMSFEVSELEA